MLTFLLITTMCIFITNSEPDQRIITTLKHTRYYMKPTIVNGEVASNGQVPYLVSIKEPTRIIKLGNVVWTNLCGGSIIGTSKVLTAAHCFEGRNFFYARHKKLLRIVAGNLTNVIVHSGKMETNKHYQWRSIKKLVIHHEFYFPSHDIALVFVDEPFRFGVNVNSVVTASRNTDYFSSCYSAGFGNTYHFGKTSTVLLVAKIAVMARSQCSYLWEMNMNEFICTDSAVTDVASGDSGGPLACVDTLDPAEKTGKDLLVGVVSGKNFDKTTIYTRVSAYRNWIASDAVCKQTANSFLIIITLAILIYNLFFHFLDRYLTGYFLVAFDGKN